MLVTSREEGEQVLAQVSQLQVESSTRERRLAEVSKSRDELESKVGARKSQLRETIAAENTGSQQLRERLATMT